MTKTYKLLIDSPEYPKGTRAIQQKSPCSITGDYSNFYTLFLPEQNNYNHHSPLGKIHKEQIENRPTVWELQEDTLDLRSLEAATVAKYFIKKSNEAHKPITNKKLQKLVYYAQAWNLVFNDSPIFDDVIEAWVHGPAIASLCDDYKKFSYNPIIITVDNQEIANIPTEIQRVLDEVWITYGKYDGDYLELLTHNEEPWQKAREGVDIIQSCNNQISTDLMKEFYTKKNEEYAHSATLATFSSQEEKQKFTNYQFLNKTIIMTKTYKLLIDSPEYPKGTRAIQQKSPCSITGDYSNFYTLFLPEQNNYNHHSPLGKIHKEQIENRPTVWELQEDTLDLRSPEAEKMREEARSNRWEFVPKQRENFFVFNIMQKNAYEDTWTDHLNDITNWNVGNCHRTKEDALAWGEKYARYFLTE